MYRSDNWEKERYIYELLKQAQIFKQWKKTQFDCQTGKCAWCEKPMQYRYSETDHIKPLYYGGTSEAQNMVLCHHNCNKNKSTKTSYARPNWIKLNRLDALVNGKYKVLRAQVVDNQGIAERRELLINPSKKSHPLLNIADDVSQRIIRICGAILIIIITAAIVNVIVLLSYHDNGSMESQSEPIDQSTLPDNQTASDLDAKRKSYAESILASYTNYYNNYVVVTSYKWSLPSDNYNCGRAGDGCSLTMYSKASLPNGYTYSINTLENGRVLEQPGTIPHASTTNVALYKRARCSANGTVVGGAESKDAASVVQLSNGSYYCVQN